MKIFKECTTKLLTDGSLEITSFGENTGDIKIEKFIYFNDEWNKDSNI